MSSETAPIEVALSCPAPLVATERVLLGHGSGGRMTGDLVARYFLPAFRNPYLDRLDDPDANPDAVELGIHPQLAVLEGLVNPRADDLQANDTLAASGALASMLSTTGAPSLSPGSAPTRPSWMAAISASTSF